MANSRTSTKISPAKGRPMLQWVGKRPLTEVPNLPAQLVEIHNPHPTDNPAWNDWPESLPNLGLLFHGDNKEVLSHLITQGFRKKVELVYIDPPFDSGADYVRKVKLRGSLGSLEGLGYELGEQVQYTDIWTNDNYLQFMYERLILVKELLAPNSNFVLHCDWRKSHHLRAICDEVFGAESFKNEIYWYFYNKMHDSRKGQLPRATNTLLVYSFGNAPWHDVDVPRQNAVRQLKRVKVDGVLKNLRDDEGNLVYQETDTKTLDNVWPIPLIPPADKTQKTDYPTQKPRALLDLIVNTYSNPGGVVLDCFVGSGTTVESAQFLGRKWIGADINKGAIHTTAKRVQNLIGHQWQEAAQSQLDSEIDKPQQLGYGVWRVNDYDLHVQQLEAVALACEHVGIERLKTDTYFDGTLGKRLVRVASFEHPLSITEVQETQEEIGRRTDEDRDVVLVCLDAEIGALEAIQDWNRLRRVQGAPNRLSVIELRTDPKYGRFIKHEPPEADVHFQRDGDHVSIEIREFVSPSIIDRLAQENEDLYSQVSADIEDWRWTVDCVQVDNAYDGKTFNVVLSDIPMRREDLVKGNYTISVSAAPTTIAVRITDMLGGEVLAQAEV